MTALFPALLFSLSELLKQYKLNISVIFLRMFFLSFDECTIIASSLR